MDKNQLGRRNLTVDQWRIIVGRVYNRRKKEISNPTGRNQHNEVKGQSVTQPKTTAQEVAEEFGISDRTVKRSAKDAEYFDKLKEGKPEIAEDVWSGKTMINISGVTDMI